MVVAVTHVAVEVLVTSVVAHVVTAAWQVGRGRGHEDGQGQAEDGEVGGRRHGDGGGDDDDGDVGKHGCGHKARLSARKCQALKDFFIC